ncbi:threonine aldolase family protein [Planococcus salinus]|uniref:Low specificity L-threonine aldolase n=1 Tax=Planococcus salinus TaxID=1848460 RepID=A0A3M8P6Y5_9BACL|nr:threonine aldolase family protein [Planococcus salinus]RNF39466.1 low specificity L-threonine aldolase [Planococcus salinus]
MRERNIDLRSDTVTLPKPEMIEAIAKASLGDDIMKEDATVNELEKKAAELLGMEDAILTISGTMANQAAIMSFVQRGQEVIVGDQSHIYNLEGAAMAAIAQVQARPVTVMEGYFDPGVVERAISIRDIQKAGTGLISLENTYNLNDGQIVSLENMKEMKELGKSYGIPVYLDGARIFNAAVELGKKPSELCSQVDAVQFCLTKGLGCPLGSVLAGSKEFIREAKVNRQRIGGGMRQAGIIAAPGIYALDHMIGRLAEDNRKASYIARKLAMIEGVSVNEVQTNIISLRINEMDLLADDLIFFLKQKNIKVKKIGEKQIRMIVHYLISKEDLEYVLLCIKEIMAVQKKGRLKVQGRV